MGRLGRVFSRVGRQAYFERPIETPGEAPCSKMAGRLLITCVSSGMAVAITVGYLNIPPPPLNLRPDSGPVGSSPFLLLEFHVSPLRAVASR